MKYPVYLLICCFFTPVIFGQEFSDQRTGEILDAYAKRREVLEVQKELSLVKLKNLYHEALASLEEKARSAGDFDNYILVEAEIKRSEISMSPPQRFATYAPLEKLQKILVQKLEEVQAEKDQDLLVLYKQLDQALVLHQQYLLKEGNVEAAKKLQALRDKQRMDPEVARAIQSAPEVQAPAVQNPGTQNFTYAQAQKAFKGNVKTFNPITREIEIVYDFDQVEGLDDFRLSQPKAFEISKGQLVITAPPNSDWWWFIPEVKCPYLLIPFVELEDSVLTVVYGGMTPSKDYHLALGYSDLGKKTLGFGPFSRNGEFTLEGWTPKQPEMRGGSSGVKIDFPAEIQAEHRGGRVVFQVKAGGRKKTMSADTDESLTEMGFFPKSFTDQGEAKLMIESISVRGTLKEAWLHGKLTTN